MLYIIGHITTFDLHILLQVQVVRSQPDHHSTKLVVDRLLSKPSKGQGTIEATALPERNAEFTIAGDGTRPAAQLASF
jgi:hypothetical protein